LKLEKPWRVTSVEKDLERETVTICVAWLEKTKVACRQFGLQCGLYDRLPERTWRHLSVM
jgi:hypothetical protein